MRDKDSRSTDSRISRRPFLASAGVSALAGLAGCTGGGSNEGATTGSNDGGDGDQGSGGTTSSGGSGNGLSGTTFTYWNEVNANSRGAKEATQKSVEQFQSDTGASIKVNFASYDGVIGAKWKTAFKQGNYPVLYDSVSTWDGQFVKGGWVEPFDNYRDAFDQETIDAIKWIFPLLKKQYSGFEGSTVYEIPFGFLTQVPHIARLDHFEKAGLDPKKDFPPKDYGHLVDVATTLQKEGPGQYGYQIHGAKFDVTDCQLAQWAVAHGGKKGLFLNEDWSDTNLDNDVWKKTVREYVDVYQKHGLSNGKTPSSGDEDVVPLMRQGAISMSGIDFLNLPTLNNQAADLMSSGTIRWGAAWPGQAKERSVIQPYTFGLTKPPKNADKATYERKQEAAIEYAKTWLSKEWQKKLHQNFGLLPVRKDVWEEIPRQKHNGFEAVLKMANNSTLGWSAHPQSVSVQYNITGPYMQKALSGELSPEEACNQAAKDVRSVL